MIYLAIKTVHFTGWFQRATVAITRSIVLYGECPIVYCSTALCEKKRMNKPQMPGTCAYLWSPDFDINRDACRAAAVLSWVWASTPSTSKSNLPRRWQRCSWSCVIHPANYSTLFTLFPGGWGIHFARLFVRFFFTENQLLWRRQAALYLVTSLVVAYLPACHINGVRCIFCWRQWG